MTQFLHHKVAQQAVMSVCRDCSQVVDVASHRMQLEAAERAHVCAKAQEMPQFADYVADWQLPMCA